MELEGALAPAVDDVFRDDALRDEQLRMMFACCHARLPEETQIALVLNLLSGFSVEEIAHALFTGEAAMEKRLQRGKAVLAEAGRLPEVTAARVAEHAGAVHGALYLLFNEGYHGSSERGAVRDELCLEAIRLTALLAESPTTATPATRALLALMCLVAARLPARRDDAGDLVLGSTRIGAASTRASSAAGSPSSSVRRSATSRPRGTSKRRSPTSTRSRRPTRR